MAKWRKQNEETDDNDKTWPGGGRHDECQAGGVYTLGFPDLETNLPEVIAWQKEFARKHVPLGGRYGELREAGLTALFLASDASNFMTGETLYLDGGLSRIHGSIE